MALKKILNIPRYICFICYVPLDQVVTKVADQSVIELTHPDSSFDGSHCVNAGQKATLPMVKFVVNL